MAETRLGWFDCDGKNQMGWRFNANLASNCQNPSGDPLNDGITDEISKLHANIGVINPSGRRRLGVIKLSLIVPLKQGEKMFNPNAILNYLEKINNRTVEISPKTLPYWQTVMNHSSSKMIWVMETKLI